MSLWLWIGLPLLFLLGLFLNAIKDMKQLEKQLPGKAEMDALLSDIISLHNTVASAQE